MTVCIDGRDKSTVYGADVKVHSSHFARFEAVEQPLQSFREVLEKISTLKSNWDGYGALPVDPLVVKRAWDALSKFAAANLPPDDVSPRSPGTIAFVWSNDSREAEIEIGKTRFVGFVETLSSSTSHLQGRSVDIDAGVVDAVRRLYQEPVALGVTRISNIRRSLGYEVGSFVPA